MKGAQAQRKLFNSKVKKAVEDMRINANNTASHSQKTRTLVVDYGQNMQIPWLGACQSGDTYYYTPLNVCNLGVIDTSFHGENTDHLYTHI